MKSSLNGHTLTKLDNHKLTINKQAALRELEFSEELFLSILDTFLNTSIDRIVDKVG